VSQYEEYRREVRLAVDEAELTPTEAAVANELIDSYEHEGEPLPIWGGFLDLVLGRSESRDDELRA
jgi:hypothetical protein